MKGIIVDLENQGYEYRFVRGLSLLLDRRGIFTCNSKVNPPDLRKKIYEIEERLGLPTTLKRRQQIIESAALELSLESQTVENCLYADLDDELILTNFKSPSALELLKQYNLSLMQTLLFDSTELTFNISGDWQKLFYGIKKLGLMYEVFQDNGFWVKVDGPASLFKLTKKYGSSIAKLLPVIIANPQWGINAKVLWRYSNEICAFRIENKKHGSLLPDHEAQPLAYDSVIEQRFASQFQAVGSGWSLKREPEPVLAGSQVIVPDFSLERAGLKVYLEIVGFWTEAYLLRKAEKLKRVQDMMILLVDEALACEKFAALEKRPQLHFIYYHNEVPLAPVLRYLGSLFEEVKAEEIKVLESLPVRFTEPVVNYAEFAQRIGFSTEAVQTFLTANAPSGYVAMPNDLVSEGKLLHVSGLIEEHQKKSVKLTLNEITRIIEAEGVSDVSCVLTMLGYRISWHGISSEQAEVYKINK